MCRVPQAVATALLLLVPGLCAAQSVNMGSTFHGLEARARRVTTTFPDVVIDVRRGDGQTMEAVLRSRAGRGGRPLARERASRRVQWRGRATGDRARSSRSRIRPASVSTGPPSSCTRCTPTRRPPVAMRLDVDG